MLSQNQPNTTVTNGRSLKKQTLNKPSLNKQSLNKPSLSKQSLNKQYQGGMTAAGWLIIMAIVLFFMYLVIKLAPAYMEYFSIKSSLESVAEEANSGTSKSDIQRYISGRFSVNSIDIIEAKDIEIKDVTGGKAMYLEYENRIPLFGNISALLEFKHEEPLN